MDVVFGVVFVVRDGFGSIVIFVVVVFGQGLSQDPFSHHYEHCTDGVIVAVFQFEIFF